MRVREATRADVPAIHRCIVDLARFERAEHEVTSTSAELERALFDGGDTPSGHPAVHAHVAEVDGEVVAVAIWFLNYSTWTGHHGIYLEDLYVMPNFRGRGIATALLAELATIAVERGYDRFQWWVLDWNSDAIEVYRGLGAVPMDEWTVHRVQGEALHTLAARRIAR